MNVDVNLVLHIVVLLLTLLVAYLAKKGLIDRATVKQMQQEKDSVTNIARAATTAIEGLKAMDKDVAGIVTREVVAALGESRKPELDTFLRAFGLNKPHDGEG